MNTQSVWVVDFGSQYTQLITRKCREIGVSAQVLTVEESLHRCKSGEYPHAFILSGGPQSVFLDQNDYAPFFAKESLPILGICYGMQLMGQFFGGKVAKGQQGEYGMASISFESKVQFSSIPKQFNVWMSHADHVEKIPESFEIVIKTENNLVAGMKHKKRPLLGLQFHPEVEHGEFGKEVLSYFLFDFAKLTKDWSAETMLLQADQFVSKSLNTLDNVLCAFSGGVDSLVAAMVVHRIVGKKLYCFFVDHGLLRPQDYLHIEILKSQTPLHIEVIDAKNLFLTKLAGASDPEEKRKIIGRTFIEVFEQKVHEYEKQHNIHFSHLLQGTLYPDVIESTSPHKKGGKSVTIKSHHNVGGLPERMKLKLLEPFSYLFKDEVRAIGRELGLKEDWIYRHPFPGPGLGIRILGKIDHLSIQKVQHSDQILFEELHKQNEYKNVWQAFTVLLPIYTVGVKGDGRAYEQVICVRMVNSSDGMTAVWSNVPRTLLEKVSSRITNEVAGITRVVYDITSKPPGTIEWE